MAAVIVDERAKEHDRQVIDFLVKAAIAIGVPAIIWWAIKFGKAPPNAAVYPPALKVLSTALALPFGAGLIIAILASDLLMSLVCLLGFAGFGFCAADAFYYRLSWGEDGFAIRRLIGGSFTVGWSQVTSAEALPDNLFRLHLNHASASVFTVSTIAIGARAFIDAARQHAPV